MKIAPNVHLHHIAGHGIVLAFFPDVFCESPNAIMCASVLDTAIAVVNKSTFIQLMRVIVIKVMHDAVTKVGSKHFSYFRIVYDETG